MSRINLHIGLGAQLAAWAMLTLFCGGAQAGFVTLHPDEISTIFSQQSFGTNGIQVHVDPTITVTDPSFENLDSETRLSDLFKIGDTNSKAPNINIFFVDSITECGGQPIARAIGCGQENGGHALAVESQFASSQTPAEPGSNVTLGSVLLAHEISHNLGLGHVIPPPSNLMNPTLSGDFTLTIDQANAILGSSLVQQDGSQHFINLTPFVVVPEPGAFAFALGAVVLLLGCFRRRSARCAAAA